MTVSYHTSTTIPAGAPATAGNAGRPATPAPQTPNVAQLAPAPLPRRRRGGWALWGAAAGALGLVATVITDPQGAVSSKEGLTAEAVDHVSRTGYHVGVVAGLVAMGCLLVAAAGWRRWAAERAPHDLAARVVSMAMVASAGAMMIGGELPARRLERLDARRGEVRLDDAAIHGVLGRIHPVGHRQVPRCHAAERLVVVQHAHDVFVPEQRPLQVVAPGDRTALAHRVVGGALVAQDFGGSGIPVRLAWVAHGCGSAARGVRE